MDVTVLPHDERIFFQVGDVIEWRFRPELEQQPPDVGVEEALGDIVGIFIVIDMFMVPPMVARPHQSRIFECSRGENEGEKADGSLARKVI